jgi:hypothetical protein
VTHQHNGAARLFCQLPQPLEDGPHLIGPVHIYTFSKVRLDGIEDQQSSVRFLDRLSDSVVAQRQFPLALVDNQHTGAVRTQRCEPWFHCIRQSVLRRLVDDVHGRQTLCVSRHWQSAGQQRSQR